MYKMPPVCKYGLITSSSDYQKEWICIIKRTCPKVVFSMRPLAIRALASTRGFSSSAEMTGVLIVLVAFMISLIRGTPWVISEADSGNQNNKLLLHVVS